MPISSYNGQTYVGYLDISGFKKMMNNKEKARHVLDIFYRTIYETLYEMASPPSPQINAIVISDCAVLFLSIGSSENCSDVDKIEGLPTMLEFIKKINRIFINNYYYPFMTTCSIAYGDFRYENRSDRNHMSKNCMMGTSYMNAFLDSESSKSKIRPGECRIIENDPSLPLSTNPFSLLKRTRKYYYFYWMLENVMEIDDFKQKYNVIWKGTCKYDRLIELLASTGRALSYI